MWKKKKLATLPFLIRTPVGPTPTLEIAWADRQDIDRWVYLNSAPTSNLLVGAYIYNDLHNER